MKFWMALVTGAVLVIGATGCNDKIKQDLAKCTADQAKATAELNAAKGELDTVKKAMTDATTKLGDITKERDALLLKVTEYETAAKIAAEQEAAKAPAPAAKKPAAKKPAPKTETGAPVPKVEAKGKGMFHKK